MAHPQSATREIADGTRKRKRSEVEGAFCFAIPSHQLSSESHPEDSPQRGSALQVLEPSSCTGRSEGKSEEGRDRWSPRARYNLVLITKLQKALELDPEADLTGQLSTYSPDRLNTLRGASTITLQNTNGQQEVRRIQTRIPEPCGHFQVISPLARQVEMLISPNSSDRSQKLSYSTPTFWSLLQHGQVLDQVLSKWIVKISASIVVKFAPGLDIGEYQTMLYVWSKRGCIPIPEPLGAFSIGTYNYILMSYIEGESLADHWQHLSPSLKCSVQSQLEDILRCLRKLPLPSKYLGTGEPPLCKDLRRHTRTSKRSISSELEFRDFLLCSPREQNPTYHDLITSVLETNHAIVMTHGDLRAENIIVSRSGPDKIEINGLVDWELSGAYPEYWEYVKALAGVTWSSSDWYSYLPVASIGKHVNAWAQECLIDRLVL